jgi:hypothetical protein
MRPLFFLAFTFGVVAAHAQSPPVAYTVTLYCERPIPLTAAAIPAIHSWALRLVSSSQVTSDAPDWSFPMSEVQQEYRDKVSGDYIRVNFASSTTIKTMHGVVHANAIVMGLDPAAPDWRSKYPDHFEDGLFTVDEGGMVVGHALYSGLYSFALGRVIGKAIADPDACKRAKGLFVKDSQLPSFIRDFFKANDLQD